MNTLTHHQLETVILERIAARLDNQSLTIEGKGDAIVKAAGDAAEAILDMLG